MKTEDELRGYTRYTVRATGTGLYMVVDKTTNTVVQQPFNTREEAWAWLDKWMKETPQAR